MASPFSDSFSMIRPVYNFVGTFVLLDPQIHSPGIMFGVFDECVRPLYVGLF